MFIYPHSGFCEQQPSQQKKSNIWGKRAIKRALLAAAGVVKLVISWVNQLFDKIFMLIGWVMNLLIMPHAALIEDSRKTAVASCLEAQCAPHHRATESPSANACTCLLSWWKGKYLISIHSQTNETHKLYHSAEHHYLRLFAHILSARKFRNKITAFHPSIHPSVRIRLFINACTSSCLLLFASTTAHQTCTMSHFIIDNPQEREKERDGRRNNGNGFNPKHGQDS